MKRFITGVLITLLIACSIPVCAQEEQSCVISMTDAYTIQGGIADVTIYYDFNDSIHALCFAVCFPVPLTVENTTINSTIREMDGVMLVVDSTEDGQVSVGILCAQEGLVGVGELMTIRFRFAPYYSEGYESVDLIVTEAYHDELGGDDYPVEIDRARANIFVHAPTADDVLAIIRYIHSPYTAPYGPWMDVNEDGYITMSDALMLFRRVLGLI